MRNEKSQYNMDNLAKKVRELKAESDSLYIYGAGIYANNIYKFLVQQGIDVDGFLVTHKDGQKETSIPIMEYKEVISENAGIILGLNSHNSRQVYSYLTERGFDENKLIDGGKYLENGSERLGFEGDAIMEITVRIGCSVNCRFCPQSNLIKKYFAEDKNREKMMSIETFRKCLEKIPKDVGIVFSGFAEPFLNQDTIEMMIFACQSGRKVDLFTTLIGADMDMVKAISKLPLHYVGLHCADRYGYAAIPVSEEYYQMIEYLVECKKSDGISPFVDFCNAQGEPDERIVEICKGRYEIGTTLFDRAGNLEGKDLIGKKNLSGKLECSMCGALTNRNVLLPDGTVLICCMDYSMKHVLGNLLEQSYDEILNGKESLMIRSGLNGDETLDILCRQCSCARVLE